MAKRFFFLILFISFAVFSQNVPDSIQQKLLNHSFEKNLEGLQCVFTVFTKKESGLGFSRPFENIIFFQAESLDSLKETLEDQLNSFTIIHHSASKYCDWPSVSESLLLNSSMEDIYHSWSNGFNPYSAYLKTCSFYCKKHRP